MSIVERLISAEDVADMLSMSVDWVHEMARRDELPSYRLGRYRRFRASEVDLWLKDRATAVYKRRTG